DRRCASGSARVELGFALVDLEELHLVLQPRHPVHQEESFTVVKNGNAVGRDAIVAAKCFDERRAQGGECQKAEECKPPKHSTSLSNWPCSRIPVQFSGRSYTGIVRPVF